MANLSQEEYTFSKVIYGIIVFLSCFGNLLVCLLFYRQRALLRKAHNVFILTLAVTDITTVLILVITPSFLLGNTFPRPFNHVAAELFCRIIWSRWLLFTSGVVSVYLCLCLTAERWIAIVKPTHYNTIFQKKRSIGYVLCATVISFVCTIQNPFEIVYFPEKTAEARCGWQTQSPHYRRILGTLQFLGKLLIPSTVMLMLYGHLLYKIKMAGRESLGEHRSLPLRKKITKIAAIASLSLILCWTPNQVVFLLSKYGYPTLETKLHHYSVLLTFISTCLNPAIYGFSSKSFRKGYWEAVIECCPSKVRARIATDVVPVGRIAQSLHLVSRLPQVAIVANIE